MTVKWDVFQTNCAVWTKRSHLGQKRLSGLGLWLSPALNYTEAAFPKLVQMETATIKESQKESQVIDNKAETILRQLRLITLVADNSYAKAMRIRS